MCNPRGGIRFSDSRDVDSMLAKFDDCYGNVFGDTSADRTSFIEGVKRGEYLVFSCGEKGVPAFTSMKYVEDGTDLGFHYELGLSKCLYSWANELETLIQRITVLAGTAPVYCRVKETVCGGSIENELVEVLQHSGFTRCVETYARHSVMLDCSGEGCSFRSKSCTDCHCTESLYKFQRPDNEAGMFPVYLVNDSLVHSASSRSVIVRKKPEYSVSTSFSGANRPRILISTLLDLSLEGGVTCFAEAMANVVDSPVYVEVPETYGVSDMSYNLVMEKYRLYKKDGETVYTNVYEFVKR